MKQNHQTPGPPQVHSFVNYCLADCAARAFEAQRPKPNDDDLDRERKAFLRFEPVAALRWLWRNGDAANRATLACRIRVRRKELMSPKQIQSFKTRILARELERLAHQ
jgi:hypothetical protein